MKKLLGFVLSAVFCASMSYAHIISGTVYTNGIGLASATVSFKTAANSLPAYQVTAASDGTYASPDLATGTYYVCASKTGCMISSNVQVVLGEADEIGKDFTLSAGRNIPKMEYLLFAADADTLTTVGSSADWTMLYNTFPYESLTTLQQMASPTVRNYHGRKMSELFRNNADGYRLNRVSLAQGQNIPVDGITVMALARPYYLNASINWCSLVDIFYSDMRVDLQAHTGLVRIYRKGTSYDVATIPDGQLTIVTLVMKADGTFKVWFTPFDSETGTFGTAVLKKTETSTLTITALTPRRDSNDGFKGYINIGRNEPDGWTAVNAYVGDVFVYKKSLDDTDRATLEADFANECVRTLYKVTSTTSGLGVGTLNYVDANSGNRIDWFDSAGITYLAPTVRWDSALAQILTNGVAMGTLPSFPWTLSLSGNVTVDFVFGKAANRTITGTVYDLSNTPVTNATVKLKGEAKGLPWEEYTTKTDTNGNYSISFPNGACYLVAAKDGYIPSAEQTVSVGDGIVTRNFYITLGRNFPRMEYMLFGLDTAQLGDVGTSSDWPLLYNTYPFAFPPLASDIAIKSPVWKDLGAPYGWNWGTGTGTPTVRELFGSKFSENDRSQSVIQGYQIGGNVNGGSSIPVDGVTSVVVFRHKRGTGGDNTHLLNIFDHNFALIVEHGNGMLKVVRNGNWNNIVQIPDGQLTMVSLVMKSDGTYKVWVRPYVQATDIFTELSSPTYTQAGTSTFTAFWHSDNDRRIRIGMNNWAENWSEFDGYIGEMFVYRTALTNDAERLTLEQTVADRVCLQPKYVVTSTVTGTGTVTPSGTTRVLVGSSINYTISAGSGKYLSNILTNGVTIGGANVPTIGSWTYTPQANASVEFVFSDTPSSWAIQGRVTDSVTGLAITNATISVITNKYSLPISAVLTDSNGDYTLAGTYSNAVSVAVSATGYMLKQGTINFPGYGSFALVPTGRNIPKMEYLFYGVSTDELPAAGGNSSNWKMMYTTHRERAESVNGPFNSSMDKSDSPKVVAYRGAKFSRHRRNTVDGASNDGYTLPNDATSTGGDIPVNGASIVMALRPMRGTPGDWNSPISFFHTYLGINIENENGQLNSWRANTRYWSGHSFADNETVILSCVVQPDGTFKFWKRSRPATSTSFTEATDPIWADASTITFDKLVQNWAPIVLGRGTDGWAVFNGLIGDTFVYRTALSDADRLTLEDDLIAKFNGATTYSVTSSANAGGSPTISTGGLTYGMGQEYFVAGDITYTFNCAWNKIVGEVRVNGNVVTPTPTGSTWTLSVDGVKTVQITYADKPGALISGQVTDSATGFPLANASVYFKYGTTATATYQFNTFVNTDTNGFFAMTLPAGDYKVAASAAGYAVSADVNLNVQQSVPVTQNMALTKNGKFIPQMGKLLFAGYADGIRPTDRNWELIYPYGFVKSPMGTIDLVTDVGQWYFNNNDPRYNGYNIMQLPASEPCNGFTAMAMFKPIAHSGGDNNWQSVIDMCYSRFCLIVNRNTLRLRVRSNDRWNDSVYLQDGIKYILSVVTQPTGEYKVYTNGVEVMSVTSTSDWTKIEPGAYSGSPGNYDGWITVGRNAPDGWSTCNGNIAAALVWKDMLSSTERETLEQDLLAKYRDGTFTVKALVAGEGLVSGAGSVTPMSTVVSSGGSVSYTITRDKCKQIKSIRVNGTLIPNMEGATAYTVENVTQDTTVEFLFKDSPAGLKIMIY